MGNEQRKGKKPVRNITLEELKVHVTIARRRLTQERVKKVAEISKKTKEVLKILRDNSLEIAKLKMDRIIEEENSITVLDILGFTMDTLIEKLSYLLNAQKCPQDLRPILDTIIYASTRLNIDEFTNFRELITLKYGDAYVKNADINSDKLVNKQIVEKLTYAPNPEPYLIFRLQELCNVNNFSYIFPGDSKPSFNFNKPIEPGQKVLLNINNESDMMSCVMQKDMKTEQHVVENDYPTLSNIYRTGNQSIGNQNQGNSQKDFGEEMKTGSDIKLKNIQPREDGKVESSISFVSQARSLYDTNNRVKSVSNPISQDFPNIYNSYQNIDYEVSVSKNRVQSSNNSNYSVHESIENPYLHNLVPYNNQSNYTQGTYKTLKAGNVEENEHQQALDKNVRINDRQTIIIGEESGKVSSCEPYSTNILNPNSLGDKEVVNCDEVKCSFGYFVPSSCSNLNPNNNMYSICVSNQGEISDISSQGNLG